MSDLMVAIAIQKSLQCQSSPNWVPMNKQFSPQVVVSPLERAYERPSDRKEGEEEDMEGEETPDMETGD